MQTMKALMDTIPQVGTVEWIGLRPVPVIASCCGLELVRPETLRRNIVVSGINLLALKDKRIRIGEVEMEVTGLCHPCSRSVALSTLLPPSDSDNMNRKRL